MPGMRTGQHLSEQPKDNSAPQELDVGHETGADRLCLRLPALVTHHITPDSALAHWNEAGGILQDADSEIVVVVRLCSCVLSA